MKTYSDRAKPGTKTSNLTGGKGKVLAAVLGIMALICLFANASEAAYYRLNYARAYSLADCLVFLKGYGIFFFTIVPVVLFFLQMALKNDFTVPFVLRRHSKRQIFWIQVKKILFFAVFFSVFYTVFALLTGSLVSSSVINFGSDRSVFQVITLTISPETRFSQVLFGFFFSCLAGLLFVSLLFLFLWWLLEKSVFVWLIEIGLICAGMFVYSEEFGSFQWIVGHIDLGYRAFLANRWWLEYPIVLILCVAVTAAGWYVSDKKEFLNAKYTE